jgi:hypothetical protein
MKRDADLTDPVSIITNPLPVLAIGCSTGQFGTQTGEYINQFTFVGGSIGNSNDERTA